MAAMKLTPPLHASAVRQNRRPRTAPAALALALSTLLFAPLGAAETDEKIVAAANSSYVFKTFLADDAITTVSEGGKVTLTGTVQEESHRQLAQETVAGLPGVKSVDNQIEIKDSPPEYSDTWLFMKVKGTLAYHKSVSGYNTQVEVNQGVATLKGEASSEAQKELTTEYARDVEGIKEVINEMTVAAEKPAAPRSLASKVDDASISAQVRMALASHRSTSAFKTSVTTLEGVVTVGGSAKNEAEKNLVTKLVTDINGVNSVVNNMIVEVAAAN
jgi:osmotically-inducible protein OsmY